MRCERGSGAARESRPGELSGSSQLVRAFKAANCGLKRLLLPNDLREHCDRINHKSIRGEPLHAVKTRVDGKCSKATIFAMQKFFTGKSSSKLRIVRGSNGGFHGGAVCVGLCLSTPHLYKLARMSSTTKFFRLTFPGANHAIPSRATRPVCDGYPQRT